MTRQHAEKEAKRRWGKTAHVRAHEAISAPEKRAAASARTKELRARRDAIDAEIKERLAQLDWYVALTKERKELVAEVSAVQWNGSYFKFAVGDLNGIGFHVYGQGDTWEEAFAQADARKDV